MSIPDHDSHRDVRMRGFTERAAVETAVEWIDEHVHDLESVQVELAEACGRVLAADVVSQIDVPPFDRSAMDGYALLGGETVGAGDYNPLTFHVLGEALPGRAFTGRVSRGTAVRIMTGAPLPEGADAVVPAEYATETHGQVDVTTAVSPGKHVGRRGEDVSQGTRVLAAGRRLRPQDVGVAASLGLDRLNVARRPRMRLLITGQELVAPGRPLGPNQIYEANSSILAGLIKRDGGVIESHRAVADDRDAIRDAMTVSGADVVLVSGGSSVGAEDHAPNILAEDGALAIHGIAMRPSSPTGMGRIGEMIVFLLPGNPVSCLCAYDFFAGRAVRRMGGRSTDWPYAACQARSSAKIFSAVGRVDYCRVAFDAGNDSRRPVDGIQVTPLAISGASILSSTTRADGFVIVPDESEGAPAGSHVTVYVYE